MGENKAEVKIFLQGKGKEGYIIGDSKSPKKGDPNLNKWQLENSLVMSWLLNTMTNEIGENFMYYDTAKEMWDAVKETYSNVDNTSAVFEIKSILHDLRQSDFSITEYFNTLSRHWQQLDMPSEVKQTKNLDSRGNTVEVNSNPSPFNKEQMEALQKILQQTISTAAVAQKASRICPKQPVKTAPVAEETAVANAEPAKTTPAVEETTVANAEPAETAPATEETAPTEARGPAPYFRKRRKGVESITAPR
ncbi:hypothetical protein SESBI_10259 [Sesbania bispinosa]|nr:hypothetical protein SESBI_10259 [Sesbania bispinosa]